MKSMEFRLIGILMVLSGCPLGAQIVIDPYFAKNPAEKSGYHLIFEDEFEGHQLDLKKWDISTSHLTDDTPCGFYQYDYMLSQVQVDNGYLLLNTELATEENSQCPVFNGCDRGISGEVKSFQYRDYSKVAPDFPDTYFQNYAFPVGSYVEIRARTTDPDCNAGSAFWLYDGEGEMDIFESGRGEYDFVAGFFSDRYIKGKEYDLYEYFKSGWQRLWGLEGYPAKVDHKQFDLRAIVPDSASGPPGTGEDTVDINTSNYFITYAVEFTETGITYFINNEPFYQYNYSDYDFKKGRLKPMREKFIRLSTSGMVLGHVPCVVACPTVMEVDYVRAYFPADKNAIQWKEAQTQVSSDGYLDIWVNYLPDVTYQWEAKDFTISKHGKNKPDSSIRIIPKSNLASNREYTISLRATFPDGHAEDLVRKILVTP